MGIGDRWQRWWDRLSHGQSAQGPGGVERRPAGKGMEQSNTPEGARPLGKVPTEPGGELKLAVEPKAGAVRQRGKVRSAGFDPYSNDAGYEKPKNWDDVDPR